MSIPSYNQGYPQDGSSLGQSKSTIRNNLDGTFLTLGIDHVNNNGQIGNQGSGSYPSGYHTTIHVVPRGANPSPITGIGQLYSRVVDAVNNDTSLFWKTGGGKTLQLTSNFTPSINANGFTFVPGGTVGGAPIIQWGSVTGKSGNWPTSAQTVTFATNNMAFQTACYNVQLTFIGPKSSTAGTLCVNSISSTGFTWQFTGSSSASFSGFYWWAIGI